jgi:hypothetical protein
VITQDPYPFDGPATAFPAAAPALQASFAGYVDETWAGLTIKPTCHPAATREASETALQAEIGRYQGQGYAIMRAGFWKPQ